MVSKSSVSASKSRGSDAMASLSHKLSLLKRQIQHERAVQIKEKVEKNSDKLQVYSSQLEKLAASRNDNIVTRTTDPGNLLSWRVDNPLCKVSGLIQASSDKDDVDDEEVVFSTTAKFPLVEKMPPYTTWIFLDRNQRMADDQSVVGRRRIYYDNEGSEALICSDSEEELGELDGDKREFSAGEDHILRLAFQEFEIDDEVVDILTEFVGGTNLEIKEHCNILREKDLVTEKQNLEGSGEGESRNKKFLDKSLSAALDSFDNLFCRRCLVFDCRLHGCSQNLIFPSEKSTCPSDLEEDRKPCGNQCYLQLNGLKDSFESPAARPLDGYQIEKSDKEAQNLESKGKHKASQLLSVDLQNSSSKKQKLAMSDSFDPPATVVDQVPELVESPKHEPEMSTATSVQVSCKDNLDTFNNRSDIADDKITDALRSKGKDMLLYDFPLKQASYPVFKTAVGRSEWKPFEKDLYLKGLEIFGRNSCFIARNLLPGLKTCKEVSIYMYGDGAVPPRGSSAMLSSLSEDVSRAEMDRMEPEIHVKSRMYRKRGRSRKVKSSWKSAGHPSLWRRIADGKDQTCKQYVPCGCQPSCGKECPCLQNGACCEKYCGCSKSCKNRFRGCHCAKSQCKSRQCPCFAAGRECDPDVCRNCWVSCGDGSLGEPPKRGDGQCGNMKLLLRQQQRILLAKSDVAGWGAFLKNTVSKNDYLGEYTGELISHREADKRGKIYDRANSSFLFDLNDQYVLDAYRKGDKLKFANHSSNPNCYAKVMLVAGDHRVGIFANERIEAGEELFYDYRYGPDQAPAWARKPEGSKRDHSPVPQGRAKKHQSG